MLVDIIIKGDRTPDNVIASLESVVKSLKGAKEAYEKMGNTGMFHVFLEDATLTTMIEQKD